MEGLKRLFREQFDDGTLRPSSHISAVKHIGPHLAEGLRAVFQPQRQTLRLRGFARAVEKLTVRTLRERLTAGLQNNRSNACVRGRDGRPYHVQDFNRYGFDACVALLRVMARGHDGHGLGARFQFDPSLLRVPAARSEDAKRLGCLSRRACATEGGTWHDTLCQPAPTDRGFEGMGGHTGQKIGRGNKRPRRGRYAASQDGRVEWRRPDGRH